MSTRESGTHTEHKGRPDPSRPGLFVCSRCGLSYNAEGQTVNKKGNPARYAINADCTTQKAAQ